MYPGDISLIEANEAASYVEELAGDTANIIFGAIYEEKAQDECTITVIATGITEPKQGGAEETQEEHQRSGRTHGQLSACRRIQRHHALPNREACRDFLSRSPSSRRPPELILDSDEEQQAQAAPAGPVGVDSSPSGLRSTRR